jgi:Trypsin-co-occurring domain 2
MADEGPSIAEVIGEVRRQLELAKADGERSSLRFDVGSVELTFTVGVDKTNAVGGGLKIWVLEAGAKRDSTATQTVTVMLSPYEVARTAAMSWSTSPGCGMADQTEPDAGRRVRSPRRSLGRR